MPMFVETARAGAPTQRIAIARNVSVSASWTSPLRRRPLPARGDRQYCRLEVPDHSDAGRKFGFVFDAYPTVVGIGKHGNEVVMRWVQTTERGLYYAGPAGAELFSVRVEHGKPVALTIAWVWEDQSHC